MRYFFLLLLTLIIGCSNLPSNPPVKDDQPVSIITGKPGGIKLSTFLGRDKFEPSLPVNAIAWRAALDVSSLVPLADVDTFGGTIVTEWFSLADRPDERIKLTIFVIGREQPAPSRQLYAFARAHVR